MYITAILMLLLLVSLIASEKKNYIGPYPFDVATTLPLRGFLALLIISHHLGQSTSINFLSQFTSIIGAQIVSVFFFISGYGLCVSFAHKGNAYLDGFLKKRMGKLLPKFIFLTIGIVLTYHFFNSLSIKTQAVDFITNGNTPLPHSWFIYAIIYVYISFYICALITKNPKTLSYAFSATTILYIIVLSFILNFPPYWYCTIISVNFGYFIAFYENEIVTIQPKCRHI